jgi:hypothetical protein
VSGGWAHELGGPTCPCILTLQWGTSTALPSSTCLTQTCFLPLTTDTHNAHLSPCFLNVPTQQNGLSLGAGCLKLQLTMHIIKFTILTWVSVVVVLLLCWGSHPGPQPCLASSILENYILSPFQTFLMDSLAVLSPLTLLYSHHHHPSPEMFSSYPIEIWSLLNYNFLLSTPPHPTFWWTPVYFLSLQLLLL